MTASKRKWLTSWIPHRLELLLSPAWRHAPRPLKNILERLEIEHLRHGGTRNGELYVAYQQIVEHGVSRRSIRAALALGQKLGLIEVFQEEESRRDIRPPNRFRLTYVPARGKSAPTDEWKGVSEDRARALVAAFKADDGAAAKAERRKVA